MKILIFGCSHSEGSYTAKSYLGGENCNHNLGWWSYVECLKNVHKDIFAIGGSSYAAWILLYKFYIQNKDYDFCLIQETTEPRATYFSYDLLHDSIISLNVNIYTNLFHIKKGSVCSLLSSYQNSMNDIKNKYKCKFPREWLSRHYSNYQVWLMQYEISKKWLISELIKDNIPVYTWGMHEDKKLNFGETSLGLYDMYEKVDNNYSFRRYNSLWPHVNKAGNTIIGNAVNQVLKNYKIC